MTTPPDANRHRTRLPRGPVGEYGYPPGWVAGDVRAKDPSRALVDIVGNLVAETQDHGNTLAKAIRAVGISPALVDADGFPANIVDALGHVAKGLYALAEAYEHRTELQHPEYQRQREPLTPLVFAEPEDRGRIQR